MSRHIKEPKTFSYVELCKMYDAFHLPQFQRLYAWKKKNVQDFFSAVVENEPGYFIGTIVCVVPSSGEQRDLTIIDGQQRITTINLLLVVLRDAFRALYEQGQSTETDVRKIEDYLKYKDYDLDDHINRFRPWKPNLKEIFDDLMDGSVDRTQPVYQALDDAQKNYVKNYNVLKTLITEHAGEDSAKLRDLYMRVRMLEFVPIICESEADVQSIYEGLNSTGLALSVSDLVKNKVMSLSLEEHRQEIGDAWEEIERIFVRELKDVNLLPKFLRHQWIANHGYISSGDLYRVVSERIMSASRMPFIYSKELLSDAYIYAALQQGRDMLGNLRGIFKNKEEKKICDKLLTFRHVGNSQIYEVLLALIKVYGNSKEFKPGAFSGVLDNLWNFCFRARFVSINPSRYEKLFADYCRDINRVRPDQVENKSNEALKKLGKLVESKSQFINNFSEDFGYSDGILAVVVFERLFGRETKEIMFSDKSIEHIVPQDPKKWNIKKRDVKAFVDNIGNLTLLHPDDNSKAKNESMAYKCKNIYEKSYFKFNQELATRWKTAFEKDPESAVIHRGIEIAKAVEEIFKVRG